jgi:hypothetical protein
MVCQDAMLLSGSWTHSIVSTWMCPYLTVIRASSQEMPKQEHEEWKLSSPWGGHMAIRELFNSPPVRGWGLQLLGRYLANWLPACPMREGRGGWGWFWKGLIGGHIGCNVCDNL